MKSRKLLSMIPMLIGIFLSSSVFAQATITFDAWMWAEPNFKPMVEAVVAEFEKLNPDIKVEMRGGGWAETRQKLMMRAAAGDAEDVMMLDTDWFYFLGSAGVLADIRELASDEFLNDLYPQAIAAMDVDGELPAVPSALTPWGMWTNQVLMKKYNLKPNVTFDDVYDNCLTLKTAGADAQILHPFGTFRQTPLDFRMWAWWNFGVELMDPEHLENGETGYNVPGTKKMYEWLRKMNKDGCFVQYGGDGRNALSHFETVLLNDGPYYLGIGRNSNPEMLGGDKIYDVFTVEAIPVLEEGQTPRTQGVGHAMAISAQSDHQEEAMRFVEFWVSHDKAIDLYTTPMGAVTPSIKGQQKRMVAGGDYDNPVKRGYIENVMPGMTFVPYTDNWTAAAKITFDAWSKVVLTDEPIDDIIKNTEATLRVILDLE